jgi:hypothetical protein
MNAIHIIEQFLKSLKLSIDRGATPGPGPGGMWYVWSGPESGSWLGSVGLESGYITFYADQAVLRLGKFGDPEVLKLVVEHLITQARRIIKNLTDAQNTYTGKIYITNERLRVVKKALKALEDSPYLTP